MECWDGPELFAATSGIVTSGLILNADAGNASSYSGTGNTWTSLTGSNSLTLVNSPGYTSSGGGGLVFNSSVSNQSATTGNIIGGAHNGLTIEIFASYVIGADACYIAGRDNVYRMVVIPNPVVIQAVCASSTAGWYAANTFLTVAAGEEITSGGVCQIAFTFDGTRRSIYVNGGLAGQTAAIASGTIAVNSVNNYTVGANVAGLRNFKGTMHVNRVYSRGLSASEIVQNFNATRSRFGI